MRHDIDSFMLAFEPKGIESTLVKLIYNKKFPLNMHCIQFLNQFSDYLAFIVPFPIIFLVIQWKRYQKATIKWKCLILNLSIEFIYLALLVNLGLIVEAIDHLALSIKSKMQN